MSKCNTDAAIKALLTPGEPDKIDADYIDRLLDAFEQHRANHARDVAGWAADAATLDLAPAQVAHIRARHLDRFLRYTAHDMRDVLLNFMAADDCRRAALLFLHGDASGYWRATPGQMQHARELCGQRIPATETPAMATEMQPLTWADLEPKCQATAAPVVKKRAAGKAKTLTQAESLDWKEEMESVFFALRAGKRMRSVLADPNADVDRKLKAILAYLNAVDATGRTDLVATPKGRAQ